MMMEKISKLKNKLFKFLPTQPVVASMTLQNPTMSPNNSVSKRGSGSHHKHSKVSIFPKEVRRKHRSVSFRSNNEPSSPKVSCMGQVHCKKKKKKMALFQQKRVEETTAITNDHVPIQEKKGKVLLWIFKGQKQSGGGSGNNKGFVLEEKAQEDSSQVITAPSLGAMKKFTSGRGSLRDFDFTLAES